MTDKQKIQLANLVLSFFADNNTEKSIPKKVGETIKVMGYGGLKKADIGHPVFEFQGKYIIYFETLDGKNTVEYPYNKAALLPSIKFDN